MNIICILYSFIAIYLFMDIPSRNLKVFSVTVTDYTSTNNNNTNNPIAYNP